MTVELHRITKLWVFDPPISCERAYSSRGPILVHQLHVSTNANGEGLSLSVKGQPTTSTGKPNGAIDWRHITPAELERLHAMVRAVEADQ